MTRLVIHGAEGRMGRRLMDLAEDHGFTLLGGIDQDTELSVVTALLAETDLVIDFSLPAGLDALLLALEGRKIPLVSGTTGLTPAQHEALEHYGEEAPVLWASNMSRGIVVLRALVEEAARRLPDWDAELVEVHHRRKVDAPSGTALTLAEGLIAARGEGHLERGRRGQGARQPGTVGIQSLRGGSVVGDHRVSFYHDGEQIHLSHIAESRDQFVRGALSAARWLVGREPGLYAIEETVD